MIELGKYHNLKVVRESEQGVYLTKDEEDAILLPNRYIPEGLQVDDDIRVFVYTDSQGRPIATTLEPKLTLHEFEFLKVTSVTDFGAFMDWGIAKELLVPFREQEKKLKEDQYSVVYLFLDEVSNRLVGSTRIKKHLDNETVTVGNDEKVDVLIYDETDMGFKVVVNNMHDGLIYKNEIFQPIQIGDRLTAYVKKIRADGKIDISIQPEGYKKVAPNSEKILQYLRKNKGFLSLTDKSSPDEITDTLNMSKKTFKKAIGDLYKQKLIRLEKDGIYLL